VGDLSKADLEGKVVFVRADLNVRPETETLDTCPISILFESKLLSNPFEHTLLVSIFCI
jgi:hypothetical protein